MWNFCFIFAFNQCNCYNLNMNFLKISRNLLFLFIIVFFVFSPVLIFAQPNTGTGGLPTNDPTSTSTDMVKLKNPIAADDLPTLIRDVLEGIIKLGIPVVALAIIYSGFLYVTAMGNESKISKAHDAILYTLLGAVLLLGAWALAEVITETVLSL